jgi:hypothetical protein
VSVPNSQPDPARERSLPARAAQADAQSLCWRMMAEVAGVLDLSFADVIEVVGPRASAHLQLMARRFAGPVFELGAETSCRQALRVFWASGPVELSSVREAAQRCDVLVLRHLAQDAGAVMQAAEGLARVRAVRDAGAGLALSVFGRGLSREIFRPGPASRRAA